MRILIVLCHPSPTSFTAALAKAAAEAATGAGHEVRLADLYREGFDPVLREAEWQSYGEPSTDPQLRAEMERLAWAEGLILVTPIWWSGLPAMLKGWIERVWRPEVAFTTTQSGALRPGLTQLRHLWVVCPLGMSRWLWLLAGQAARKMALRGLRPCLPVAAKTRWIAIHAIDTTTSADRDRFIHNLRTQICTMR